MRRHTPILALLLALLTLAVPAMAQAPAWETAAKYTLYIGTADKDTQAVEIPREEARALILDLSRQYTGGLTLLQSEGVWFDGDGAPVTEPSFVLILLDIDEARVHELTEALRAALNQTSILVEKSTALLRW